MREVRYDGIFDALAEGLANLRIAVDEVMDRGLYVSPSMVPHSKKSKCITLDTLTQKEQMVLPEDVKLLDTLVMARHVFKYLSATPREFLVPDIRQALERQNHHAEQVFIHLVAAISASQSFSGLSTADAAKMEQNLFDSQLPLGE